MSQENVEIATRAKAALMPGDLDTVLKLVGRSVNAGRIRDGQLVEVINGFDDRSPPSKPWDCGSSEAGARGDGCCGWTAGCSRRSPIEPRRSPLTERLITTGFRATVNV